MIRSPSLKEYTELFYEDNKLSCDQTSQEQYTKQGNNRQSNIFKDDRG